MNFINISLFSGSLQLGPKYSGTIGALTFGPRAEQVDREVRSGERVPRELRVPFRDITENPLVVAYLSWHTAQSHFRGRDAEMEQLPPLRR